mgnify:CR=1 FL=1
MIGMVIGQFNGEELKEYLSFQKEIEVVDFDQNPTKALLPKGDEIVLFWEEYPNFSLTLALIQQID